MPTLLVVDDNPVVLTVLRHVGNYGGFTVLLAQCGKDALALFEAQAVDGALVDVHMPGMNGVEICRALRARAQQAGRDLPVWLMTGACTEEIRRHAAEVGVLAILTKPFDLEKLVQELKTGLNLTPAPAEAVENGAA
jgi:CheY-like chemotaxis protein